MLWIITGAYRMHISFLAHFITSLSSTVPLSSEVLSVVVQHLTIVLGLMARHVLTEHCSEPRTFTSPSDINQGRFSFLQTITINEL